ncbi:uncharacterized protein [Centruroides vittatus]|uniref:uncharacterized protein isoform X2 n=1 Tax=Centruroides vittatus TaxID=120091 RepID=UPI00350FF151
MGFCGCSLFNSTVSASVIGIIISIYGIIWRSIFFQLVNITISNLKFFREDGNGIYANIMASLLLLYYNKTVKGIVIASLVIYVLWLVASIAISIANQKRIVSILRCWVWITITVILSDVAFLVYFLYQAMKDIKIYELKQGNIWLNHTFTGNLIMAVLFDKGIIILAILISLTVYVCQRANEISREKTQEANQANLSNYPLTSQINQVGNPDPRMPPSYGINMEPFPGYSGKIQIPPSLQMLPVDPNRRFSYTSPPYESEKTMPPNYAHDRCTSPQYAHERLTPPQYAHERASPSQYRKEKAISQPYYHGYPQKDESFHRYQTYGERLPEPEVDYDIDRYNGPQQRGYKRY